MDREAVMEHSGFMDIRSRGRAAQLVFDRPVVSNSIQISGPSFPGNSQQAIQALSTLEALKTAFKKRLAKAKAIGDEIESGMLSEELAMISEAHRLLDVVLEGYLVG